MSMKYQRRLAVPAAARRAAAAAAPPARAFCGFYVAKADTSLFNQASKVVMVRDGERTVMTMANDYQGDPEEFAIVVPVPTFLEEGQIHVGDRAVIEHLDAYTAPRLVEYFDPDPCERRCSDKMGWVGGGAPGGVIGRAGADEELGVTIEAQYKVGEYDILILSAKESDGLETWLKENGYQLPPGAAPVLGSYIRQNMRFFVAKVNLEEQAKLGYTFLRPLQVAYESPKFLLPIRLGTLNANGPQELFVFALNRTGRIETTNYRTIRLPSDVRRCRRWSKALQRLLPRPLQPPGGDRRHARGLPRIRLGHGLVRPLRRRAALRQGSCASSASSGWRTATPPASATPAAPTSS